jgi:hypothetical protein
MAADPNGFVSFNIPGNNELAAIECKTESGWKRFEVDRSRLRQSKRFVILLDDNSIAFQ